METDNTEFLAQRHVCTRGDHAAGLIGRKIAWYAAKRGYYPEAVDVLIRVAMHSNFLLGGGAGGEKDFDAESFLNWIEAERPVLAKRTPDAPPPQPRVKRLSSAELAKLSPLARVTYANRLMTDDAGTKDQS